MLGRDFPQAQQAAPRLRDGGPLLAAFTGVRTLLEDVFPPERFRHLIVQPRMSVERWKEIARQTPFVGLSFATWNLGEAAVHFRGDVTFPLFLGTSANRPEDLLAGAGDRALPGVFGMVNVAIQALHGKRIDRVGLINVRAASNVEAADWIGDRAATSTLAVVVKNVGYDQHQLTADMADFKGSDGTWDFAGATTQDGEGAGEA